MLRKIIQIDEAKCDGCGLCVPSCQEGALQVIDGKLRLVADYLCDGLGACVKECPRGALQVVEKEAEPYDEIKALQYILKGGQNTLKAHLKHLYEHGETGYLNQALNYLKENKIDIPDYKENNAKSFHFSGCPGSREVNLNVNKKISFDFDMPSALSQWPIQAHLINPNSSIWDNADILIAADCVAFAYGSFHNLLRGKKLIIACPKLDHGQEIYFDKFVQIFSNYRIKSVTVAIMEVPCCSGLFSLVKEALEVSSSDLDSIEVKVVKINGTLGLERIITFATKN